MQTYKFRTNINCENCVRTVSGFLNDVNGISKWQVDTDNPERILTVAGEGITEARIIEAIEEAGFNIVVLKDGL